ncbi:HNH endonuclease [Vitreimonas sp.]|uniref:HNH endonuclease n=1 Tax=Vitreimonas sp. TaxID=3069702 RepID=UPI002EDBA4F5
MTMAMRRCLLEPPPEVWPAAERLLEAVRLHNANDMSGAAECFREADLPIIGVWFKKVVGPYDASLHGPHPEALDPPRLPMHERRRPRMVSSAGRRDILARDGYHCRFCGMPVIPKDTIKAIASVYPKDAPWTDNAAEQHRFFQAANLQFDHIIPHARGGESSVGNMVVTCAVCNYGRMSNTLEESFLIDPRAFPVQRSSWDGLQCFVPQP